MLWHFQYTKLRGQGKPTALLSANINGLSASPPAGNTLMEHWAGKRKAESKQKAESTLRKAESRAVDLPGPEAECYSVECHVLRVVAPNRMRAHSFKK
jgi:hypothetical protein